MPRILVVDDRPDNLVVVDRYLTEAGHTVETVCSAELALARIAVGQRYDLFVLDVVLPGMNGYELCSRLRARTDTVDVPVLFLTGLKRDIDDKVKGFDVGANDYLSKPVDRHELLARVGVLLRLQRALTEAKTANERLERIVDDRTAELRDALQSLERQRRLLEDVVHGLPSAVLVHDDDGALLKSNGAAEDFFGPLSAGAKLQGTKLAPFFDAESRRVLIEVGSRVTQVLDTERHGRRFFEAEASRLEGNDDRGSWLLHLSDVTSRVDAIDEAKRRDVAEMQGRIDVLERQLETGNSYRMTQVIGHSPAMAIVHQRVDQLRRSRASVLISGESGTGKELVARAIHFDGDLRDRPFVPVHCGAIPASLAESELFGYVRGAFTGAARDVKGLFEVANGGTIFLDEIGECSPDVQTKLLRVLQSGEIRPVGASREKIVDVRLIAASNQSLAELARQGLFREDLYYRLNVVQIDLPPLRDRVEDIPELALHLLETHAQAREGDRQLTGFSREAIRLLESHPWAGNVRELENVIVRAVALSRGPLIQAEDLSPRLRGQSVHSFGTTQQGDASRTDGYFDTPSMVKSKLDNVSASAPRRSDTALSIVNLADAVEATRDPGRRDLSLPQFIMQIERRKIAEVLKAVGGNRIEAAKILGIGKSSLYRKIKELAIDA